MKLIFLYGPPAVGKLTIAKRIEKLANSEGNNYPEFKVFHNQMTVDLITPIIPWGEKVGFRLNGEYRMLMYEACAELDINLITTMVYDHPSDATWVKKMIDRLSKLNVDIHFIQLICDDEILMERVTEESRQAHLKITNPETLVEVMKKWDLMTKMDFVDSLTFDTGELLSIEVANKILSSITFD